MSANSSERLTEAGYLYVLTHPSDPKLYKIGKTTRHPEERLAEHNCQYEKYAGKIVKETGQKWELKTFVPVPDTYWAEAVFWGTTEWADIPFRGGIEVAPMNWATVQKGLDAVSKAGIRPPPSPLPDHVYAYKAWMNKRLKGRGISLVGHVKSKFGKSNFRCDSGHEWRTTPNNIAEGEGCPQCGIGERTPQEISRAINVGVLYLLVHPDQPGFIRIGTETSTTRDSWGDWQEHRYRSVEEPDLAKSLFWELLGHPQPHDNEPVSVDLNSAEEAFRNLHFRLVSEIALVEKAKEASTAEERGRQGR